MADRFSDEQTGLINVPSGTVTFLFTDIEGSTQLLERLREDYATVLAEHRDLIRAVIAQWDGHELGTQGDSFFVAFARAQDAILCVIAAQRALAAHSWPKGVSVRVRMGLHTGEPIIARTGYVGMDVHRAARIAATGHGGQVVLSQSVRELIYQDLPTGVTLRDLGAHKLKDIRFPQQIYQLVIEGLPSEFAPLKTLATDDEPPTTGNSPFKGLQFFDEVDADLFFGRDQLTVKLVAAVGQHHFLAVIGASGSGKSSIVRAGLVPALRRSPNALRQIHVITPTAHPLEALATSLTRGTESVSAAATLIDDLARDPRSLHLFIRKSGAAARTLLIVDQFEELFTLCRNETERHAFVDNLLYAVEAAGSIFTVVVTLRADFYEQLAQYTVLREAVAKHQEYIGPMSAVELRLAIEEPARLGGWEFAPGLVDLMLHDVGADPDHLPEPGALPLLSHALLETWNRRRGNVMTLKGYSEAGGVRGAIAYTAESVFSQELNPEQQVIARSIFLRLTELGEGTQDTRRRASLDELFPPEPFSNTTQVEDVLNKLTDARLITTSAGTVEVAHEALIREWATLREWLNQDREGLRLHRHLTEAAQEWEVLQRDPGALLRGARLAQAREWAEANPRELNVQERAFLAASTELAEREAIEHEAQIQHELETAQKLAETEKQRAEENKRAAGRLRQRAIYLSGALAVALIAVTVAVFVGIQFQKQSRLALSRQLAAQALSHLDQHSDLALLLSIESRFVDDTPEARGSLLAGVARSRRSSLTTLLPGHTNIMLSVAFSPDGKTLASGSQDRTIILWDVSNPNAPVQLGAPLKGHINTVSSVAFSPDGKTLASGSWDMTIILWDMSNPKAPAQLGKSLTGHIGVVVNVAFSPDGKMLASGSWDGTIILWDVSNPQSPAQLGAPLPFPTTSFGSVLSVAFSPNGRTLAVGSELGKIILWDVSNPKAPVQLGTPLNGHANSVNSLAFSPDGKTLASGNELDKIILWDVSNPKEPVQLGTPLTGHVDSVTSVAFSPDGKTLASGSADKTIILWDVSNPQVPVELGAPLIGHVDVVNSVAFSPDGKTLASGSRDKSILLWNIDQNSWQELACQSVRRNLTRAEWAQYLGDEPYRKTCPQWPEAPAQ